MTYTPDCWVVLKLDSKEHGVQRRVFATWYGGYLGSDSWKLSSSVLEQKDCGDYFEFHNQSGSVYRCSKSSQGMSGYGSTVFARFKQQETDDITVEVEKL